jgi:hypothetical protein
MTMEGQGLNEKLDGFVNRYLVVKEAKCQRHCQEPARFVPLSQEKSGLVAAYVCPGNHVARVVYFSLEPDPDWFEKSLKGQIGDLLRSRDLRSATRHGWELGGNAETDIQMISDHGVKQYYWTFYPKSEEEKTMGAFQCLDCGKLFSKQFADDSKLCSNCRKS